MVLGSTRLSAGLQIRPVKLCFRVLVEWSTSSLYTALEQQNFVFLLSTDVPSLSFDGILS